MALSLEDAQALVLVVRRLKAEIADLKKRLETVENTRRVISYGGAKSISDHGLLIGLLDDDHTQYYGSGLREPTVQNAGDVDKTAIGDDKILVYKTASSKHEYEAKGGGGLGAWGFRAYQTSGQAIPDTTWTKLEFDAENFDVKNEFDLATETFTPSADGYYLMQCTAMLLNVPDGKKNIIMLKKNGTVLAQNRFTSGTMAHASCFVETLEYLTTSDDVTVEIYHDAGVQLTTSATREQTFFFGWRLA